MHQTIKKVTEDIENLRLNTAIAALMEWYNEISKIKNPASAKASAGKQISKPEIEVFLKLLAPFAPHMTEELWQGIRKHESGSNSIHLQSWPRFDPKMLEEKEVTIVVQVNGKLRDTFKIESGKLKMENEVEERARESKKVVKYLVGREIKKVIYVPGKIINFVVEN